MASVSYRNFWLGGGGGGGGEGVRVGMREIFTRPCPFQVYHCNFQFVLRVALFFYLCNVFILFSFGGGGGGGSQVLPPSL